MDNYNPDLILDLAAGRLPEAEARAAEASLDAAGRAELAAQRAVLAAVADAPPVGMTDIERAHLHRSVTQAIAETTRELPPVRAAASSSPTRRPRSVAWMRWASAATAAAMLVGVVAVGSQLGSGSESTAETVNAGIADQLVDRDTAAVGAQESLESTATTTAPTAGDGSGEDGGVFGDSNDSLLSESDSRFLLQAPPLDQAPEDANLEELTDFVTEAIDARRIPVAGVTSLSCYEVASEDDDLDIVRGFLVPYPGPNGEALNAIAFSDAGTATVEPLIWIYDLATCESLAVNE